MITGKQRAYLRSLAQKEESVVYVGKSGVTEALLASCEAALAARELVKGRVQEACPYTAGEAQAMICEALGAEGVQVIGRVFVIYRAREKDPAIRLPKA